MNNKYDFESVDTSGPSNADDVAYALIGAFGALASLVVGESEQKKSELFSKLDKALKNNEGATSYIELARIAQSIKFSLSSSE